MTVTAVHKDPQALTMTIEAEFDASPDRVWQLWADPRQLERWWGPPTYPATFTRHDLAPGGRAEYQMIGPQGDLHRGYWEILEAEAPHRLVFRDGVASADGTPTTDLPLATTRVTIDQVDVGCTRMSIESRFPSVEAMEWITGRRAACARLDSCRSERSPGMTRPFRFEMGVGTGRPGIEDELRERGLPVVPPSERLAQVRETVRALRELDGPTLHTRVVMAVRGPKAQALAAEGADTVTFAQLPGESRGEVARLARDFRAIRDDVE